MSNKHADVSGLQTANTRLTNIKSEIFNVWTGTAASSHLSQYNNILSSINIVINQVELFNVAVDKLEIYKANKERIEELENLISREESHPSKKSTETGTLFGRIFRRTVYVVDQSKINDWQSEINTLTKQNQLLRSEINTIINCINGVENGTIGDIGNITITDADGNDITAKLNQSLSAHANLLPKNNSDIAHRGYRPGDIYDNTAEGFIMAGKKGFWGCEADIRFDSNGNLVCSHNTVTNGQNPTSFSEYLDICKEYGMTAIIDLKYEGGVGKRDAYLSPAVIDTINQKGMINSCVIQTNNTVDIPQIRQKSSDARIWYLTDNVSDKTIQIINDNNVECVNIKCGDNDHSKIKTLTANGTDVCVWNVYSEDSKNKRLNYGAKYVMSDNVLGITPYQEGEKDFNGIAN